MIKNKSKKFSQKVKFAKFWLNVCWICAIILQLLIAFLGVDLLFVNASLGFFMLALIQEVRLSKYELLKRIEVKESPLFVFKCEQQVERINRGKMFKSPEKVKATFVDVLSREIIEAEIELLSFEFQTKERAYDWVSKKVDDWIYDEGNIKFCTFLEPLLWDVI